VKNSHVMVVTAPVTVAVDVQLAKSKIAMAIAAQLTGSLMASVMTEHTHGTVFLST
jgi:hypothetical protein